jgi:calcineurin-like phosphoesterase family protein
MTIAVFGDVGGHLHPLQRELTRLGADPDTLELPSGLTVVQVGDLVHRGPDSEAIIALVDRYLTEQPNQWVQLVGNHEAQYVREPAFHWPERIDATAAETVASWWGTGRLRAAAAVAADDEQFLITHAGLTEGFWREALGAPESAIDAARALNSFIGTHEDVLFSAGQMLGGGEPNYAAGPVWASAAGEVIPSWLQSRHPMPFSLVHGHSSVADWRRRSFTAEREVGVLMAVDEQRAHATATLPGGRIIGIDPGHGRTPREPWQALVLSGAVAAR